MSNKPAAIVDLHPRPSPLARVLGHVAALAQGPDLEIYPADFDPTRKGEAVEFWVPVKE